MLRSGRGVPTTSEQIPQNESGDGGEHQWGQHRKHGHYFDEDLHAHTAPVVEVMQEGRHHRSGQEDGGPDQNGCQDVEAEPFANPTLWCDPVLEAEEAIQDGDQGTFPGWHPEEFLSHGRAGHRAQLHK